MHWKRNIATIAKPITFAQKSRMNRYEGWNPDKLIARIHDLEAQLTSNNDEASRTGSPLVKGTRSSPKPKKIKTNHASRLFEFDRYEERYVAFKFAYLGWHYNGLVTQDMPTELPTVEEEIFNALLKARLIDHPEKCKFSRCGRTDKGVSAMGQVMALNVRSARLRGSTQAESEFKELPWMDQINGLLPPSIRILAYDDSVSPDFDARFSCKKRHYKYLIAPQVPGSTLLDRDAMNKACSYFTGEHDFRNFCKLDASKQITNFKRTILRCEINVLKQTPSSSAYMSHEPLGLYVLDLEGTAFLWHQVRCITGILLLVGQGLEKPEIVKELLDTQKTPTKPVYEMADDWPLTLYDCDFGDQVNWKYPEHAHRIFESTFQTFHEARIKDAVSSFLVNASLSGVTQEVLKPGILLGDGKLKVQSKYVPVMERNRLADVSELNAMWAAKKERKKKEKAMEKEDQDMCGSVL